MTGALRWAENAARACSDHSFCPRGRLRLRLRCTVIVATITSVERLRSVGVTIRREIKERLDHNLQACIRDPDGNDIELMQFSEASPRRSLARGQRSARRDRGYQPR